MALPKIENIDLATPVQNYFAIKRQKEQDNMARENNAFNRDYLKSKVESQNIERKTGARKEVESFTNQLLMSLSPDDPQFDQKKFEITDAIGNYAHQLGVPPEEITRGAEMFVNSYTPEVARQHWIKSGMIKEPKQELYEGQLITYGEDGARAEAIPGLKQKSVGSGSYSPSNLQKLIAEREAYINQGYSTDDPIIKAYDSKISGDEIDATDITQEEIDTWGQVLNLTGKMPSLGRGKESTAIRMRVAKSAARQALDAGNLIPGADPSKSPTEAALDIVATQTDTKAIGGAISLLQKQSSSMGSFVNNLEQQVDKVASLSKDLETFDTRLLNIPLRAVRGQITGSPLQAKYDMYLAEIESEIGKLATGSTASIAELSATAQDKWAKIHDKNLSINDMLSLLEETKSAARMRMRSVEDELEKARTKMRKRGVFSEQSQQEQPNAQAEPQQNTVTVTNPATGEEEVWDLTTETRIK